jgi:hypothetical protein
MVFSLARLNLPQEMFIFHHQTPTGPPNRSTLFHDPMAQRRRRTRLIGLTEPAFLTSLLPMLVLLTKDLFFVPRVRSAAAPHNVEVAVVLSTASEKFIALPTDAVTACITDLSSVSVEVIAEVVETLRQRFPQAKLIAFGPHVQEQRLAAAQAAGCHQVLTRGQLDKQIDRLIIEWIAPSA